MPEKYAVIGKGGREHAYMRQLRISLEHEEVIGLPGNPGMGEIGECFAVDLDDPAAIAEVAEREGVTVALVGPEMPLIRGVVDRLEKKGIRASGPDKAAARIEGSKSFTKELCRVMGIPTAKYGVFRTGREKEALDYYRSLEHVGGGVIKADGPAAGKGVLLPESDEEAEEAINEYLSGNAFGAAGEIIVIERRLQGPEISIFVLTDGEEIKLFGSARDYKRLLDGDKGPNTGGMGSYAPVEDVPPELAEQLAELGVKPALEYLKIRGMAYKGILYAGFILTEEGPMLLEFNARGGDPETQVIVPRLESNFADHVRESADGKLESEVVFKDEWAVTVALASPGYPDRPDTGAPIEGLPLAENMEGVLVFHGGTKEVDGELRTDGGRVLYVTGFGKDTTQARKRAYDAAEKISWTGLQKRTDIAA